MGRLRLEVRRVGRGCLAGRSQDRQKIIIPVGRIDIERAINELKSAPLLAGYRGKPVADIEAAIDAIMAIQAYAISQSETLVELDVNPLLLCAKGKGAFAADALIVFGICRD